MNSADREHFLQDLRAAVMAGVPIDIGLDSGAATDDLLTLESLKVIGEKAQSVNVGDSRNSETDRMFPPRLAVAAEVFQATGDMPLVLSGLSASTQAARLAVRSLRWTIAYLVIVLLVAWLGMLFFAIVLVPEMESMRADFLFSRRPEVASSNTSLPWIGYLAYLFGAILFCILVVLCTVGMRKFVMLVGGRYFVRSRVDAVASKISSQLVHAGIDSNRANGLAYRLAGSESMPSDNVTVDSANSNQPDGAWRTTSFYLRDGDRYLNRMRASVPSILVFLVGGCIALIYGTAVFAPIVELIRDLMISGV